LVERWFGHWELLPIFYFVEVGVSGTAMAYSGQEKAMWMLVIYLAVDLPRKVDVKGWGVLLGGISGFTWVVDVVHYDLHTREGTGFMGKVLNRDCTVPCWLVWSVMPV